MRYVLRDRREVAHYWANQVQSKGGASSLFFEDDAIYSYGRHFCIAKHLPDGSIGFTTRSYSNTTARHKSIVRAAIRYKNIIYVHDPDRGPYHNLDWARKEVAELLADAKKPHIREGTRARYLSEALSVAENANKYLQAFGGIDPNVPDVQILPIQIENMGEIADQIARQREAQERAEAERQRKRAAELVEEAYKWRVYQSSSTSLHWIPPMLRMSKDRTIVETSHGAYITVGEARRLWPLIQRVIKSGKGMHLSQKLGHYTLTEIGKDGSIKVGCHDIAYAEIEGIARELNLLPEGEPA